MSISSVYSSTSSGYNSSEIQIQKSVTEKVQQSLQTDNGTKAAAADTKTIETKSPSGDGLTTEISIYGDTVEISEQGKLKAKIQMMILLRSTMAQGWLMTGIS